MFYYRKYLPVPELRPHISWFYLLEYCGAELGPYTLPSTANPSCAMVFNYGERYRLSNAHYQDELLPRCFLSGTSTEPYKIGFSGNIGSLGVIFRSPAFKEVFQLPDLEEFTDKRLDADLFLGKKLDGFTDALAEAPTPEDKIRLANRCFLELFKPRLHDLGLAERAAITILNTRGFLAMDDLAQQLRITPRHLRRVFKEHTGVSPKFFARLKRFGYAFYCVNTGKFNWRELTGANGFYDQANLIREFKIFSGMTPSTYIFDKKNINFSDE